MKGKDKWNERYRSGGPRSKDPSDVLVRWETAMTGTRALDVACGAGRNSLFLASKGYSVDAIDYSEEALKIARRRTDEEDLEVNWIRADLNEYNLPVETYDLVLVSHLHPEGNLKKIKESIKDGGFILYEHHVQADQPVEHGPSDDRFLFEPNELLDLFSEFQILEYREGIETHDDGKRSATARLVARKTEAKEKSLLPLPQRPRK